MIYLDNSATTFPKPAGVRAAMGKAIISSANPGRSGHNMSMKAAEEIYAARKTAADFFGVDDETRVIFTPGCTFALNTAIKGLMSSGGHIVVSELEHNAVMRPIEALKDRGVTYTVAKVTAGDDDKTVDSFRKSINAKTKMIVCTHASNVWGIRLPVERLCALAHTYGLLFVVDAAQSAGVLPLNMQDGYDVVCTAGHKSLYGPMGTGLMLLTEHILPATLTEGGTGSNSESPQQPEELPDRYESGTPNYPGIAGLRAGIEFVSGKKPERIARHEFRWIQELYRRLQRLPWVQLYTPLPEPKSFVPILSFNLKGHDSEEVAGILNQQGIAVRAGLHCCPAAHRAMDTLSSGAVRVSPSVFTTDRELDKLVYALRKITA